jgi:iron complex transport system permease protein
VALVGAGLVLACDIAGRVVNYPYEIPIGTMLGVVGSGLFLYLLLRKNARLA